MLRIRVKAFTLLEMMVALLISAILSIFVYAALSFFQKRQTLFSQQSEELYEVAALRRILKHDFDKSSFITISDAISLMCYNDSTQISYLFEDKYVLRSRLQSVMRPDTFRLGCKEVRFYLDEQEVHSSSGLIDAVSFGVVGQEDHFYLFYAQKLYSNAERMTFENIYK